MSSIFLYIQNPNAFSKRKSKKMDTKREIKGIKTKQKDIAIETKQMSLF